MEKISKYPSNNIIIKKRPNFSLNFVSKEDVPTEIKVTDVSKGIQ